MMITPVIQKLLDFCENEQLKGYDPYDVLNSNFDFRIFGKFGPILAIQLNKRNPINLRPLLGIKKEINPKGMGLFLKAYSLLYKKTQNKLYLEQARSIFQWLKDNYSKGFSGYAWGYNFDWASSEMFLPAYTPSVVVTSFVIDGIFAYYEITKDESAVKVINSASSYIIDDIPISYFTNGIAFSYTHLQKDCCYNASLLAAEILAKKDHVNNSNSHKDLIKRAIDFVVSKQHPKGEWWYSYNQNTGTERNQIDFHQGFILVSLSNLIQLTNLDEQYYQRALTDGLSYYHDFQFYSNGRSKWRIPNNWPVDIHNQSQGIITFSKLKALNSKYLAFARSIAQWSMDNMQSPKGYFFYRKYLFLINKIPYIRWGQAWMLLALAELLIAENE